MLGNDGYKFKVCFWNINQNVIKDFVFNLIIDLYYIVVMFECWFEVNIDLFIDKYQQKCFLECYVSFIFRKIVKMFVCREYCIRIILNQ